LTGSEFQTNLFFRWADDSQREDQTQGIFASTPYPVFPQYRKKPGYQLVWQSCQRDLSNHNK
jgi:hypothetical protein